MLRRLRRRDVRHPGYPGPGAQGRARSLRAGLRPVARRPARRPRVDPARPAPTSQSRFPDLAGQPIVETRVCQYETTPDTNFVIDRHPDFDNVWLVGGGSGHGFKHGPVIGEYVVERIDGAPVGEGEERFGIDRPRISQAGVRTGGDSIVSRWQGY